MRFPNAYKGVGRIYKAEILMLITSVLLIIAGIIMIAALPQIEADNDGALAVAGGALIVMLVSSIVATVAFILNLMGISSAMKDEPSFKMAMICTCVAIGASVLSSILSSSETVSDIFNTVYNIAKIIVTLMIIQGICNLSVRMKNQDMLDRGKRLMYLLLIVQCLALVASIISAVFQRSNSGLATAGVLLIISAIIDIVESFMYLGYISKAKKMLEK